MPETKKAPAGRGPRQSINSAAGEKDTQKISFFRTKRSKRPNQLTVNQVLAGIRDGEYRELVEELQEILETEGVEAYKAAKNSTGIPCFTASAVCEGGHSRDHMMAHTGLIIIDVDPGANPKLDIDELREDDNFLAVHLSLSGRGAAIWLRCNPDNHKGVYAEATEYLQREYGLKVDSSADDVTRLRFVSYDPDMKEPNWDAPVWDGIIIEKQVPQTGPAPEIDFVDLEGVEERIEWAEKKGIPVFETEEDYFKKMIVPLSAYGEEAYHYTKRLVKVWEDATGKTSDRDLREDWERAQRDYPPKAGGIKLGSFIDAFKEAGYGPKVSLSRKGKKGRPKGSKNKKKTPGKLRNLYDVGTELTDRIIAAEPGVPLVENFIITGELTLMAGPNNVGKSIQAIQWGVDVARGHKRVLYIDWELSYQQHKPRYEGYPWPEYFARSSRQKFWEQDMGTDDLINILGNMVEEYQPALLIIDNITAIEGTGDTTQAVDAKAVMEWLTEFKRIQPDMGILVLMHTVKIKKYMPLSLKDVRGSGVYSDLTDSVVIMNRVKPTEADETPQVYLKQEKTRTGRTVYGEHNCLVKRIANSQDANFLHFTTVGDRYNEEELVSGGDHISERDRFKIEDQTRARIAWRLKLTHNFTHDDLAELLEFKHKSRVTEMFQRNKFVRAPGGESEL